MAQAGGDVDVAGHERPQAQRLGPAGNDFGHLHRIHTAGEFVGDEDDRLRGVAEHRLHLIAVRHHSVHIRWQKH